ncbi:hypothetical protein ACPA9J_09530 [Pseudomonas aeruginosa]
MRNITTEAFAGVAADEWTDPRPLAEILRQWSTVNPEFLFLPRKFKIALSSAVEDRAAVQMHDIGLYLYRHPDARRVAPAGPGRRRPGTHADARPGDPRRPAWQHLLSYVEAILRVYNRYGRRDNKYKARIKILVKALGIEAFAREVEEEWQHLRDGPAQLTAEECQRVAERFVLPRPAAGRRRAGLRQRPCGRSGLRPLGLAQRPGAQVPGYASVVLSTKPGASAPPGDTSPRGADGTCRRDRAGRYGFGEIRVAHEQNLVLPDVRLENLHALWREACASRPRHA